VFRRGLGIVLTITLVTLLIIALNSRPSAVNPPSIAETGTRPYSIALLGDVPYTKLQLTQFPRLVDQVNADPDIELVGHLGNIKDSSRPCSDAYFERIQSEFERFDKPLVYTPGDNEWADCHKPKNGSFDPEDRLAQLRQTFFEFPNTPLASRTSGYQSYGAEGFPENVRFGLGGVTFGAIHLVGAKNGLEKWTDQDSVGKRQRAEVEARTKAAVQVVLQTFTVARNTDDRAVVFFTQADMFDPESASAKKGQSSPYGPVVAALAKESAAFPGPVYLFNGHSQVFRTDRPLSGDAKWPEFYGVAATSNLRRVTVEGGAQAKSFVKVRVDLRDAEVLSIQRVPLAYS